LLNGRGLNAHDTVRDAGYCSSNDEGANFQGWPTIDTVKWLSGEDDPAFDNLPGGSGNAIRDMWEPNCFGDPGAVSDDEYHCADTDSGGVHTNSGVPNRAFALMVDGDSALGIDALGLTKAAHIQWAAQKNYLTPASDFSDNAAALQSACNDLKVSGAYLPELSTSVPDAGLSDKVILQADCDVVDAIIAEVEFTTAPDCSFEPLLDPDAPALCVGQGAYVPIESEDWEGGVLPVGWTVGTHSVANEPSFSTPDWAVVGGLPEGANGGYAAFVQDFTGGDCAANDESGALYLDSPVFEVPGGVYPQLAFDHWVATENQYDGGNLKISVNGGAWTLVPAENYEFNAYNDTLASSVTNTNPLASEDAFTGTDEGTVLGSWGQSQVNLLGLATGGDEVQFRFDFGVDGCAGAIGWFVDDVQLYSCTDEALPVCGNSAKELGESCDDGNLANGDGCSDVCQVEEGWFCKDPVPASLGTNVVGDGSFEAGVPNPSWTPDSTITSISGFPLCGPGNGCPYAGVATTGVWNIWIGGNPNGVSSSVTQVINIPETATDLTMQIGRLFCGDPSDTMHISLDDNDIGTVVCDDDDDWFVEQTYSVAGYNDGADHTLVISATFAATDGSIWTNILVDDVILEDNLARPVVPSICLEYMDDFSCNEGVVGFNEGIPDSWSVSDYNGSGLVWSDIAGAGEAGNYTGGSGNAATASSYAWGPAFFDTGLSSSPFSLPAGSTSQIEYLVNYQNYAGRDFLDLDITNDGGSSWSTLLSWNEDHGGFFAPPGVPLSIDLSAYEGQSDLQLRWRYHEPEVEDAPNWLWYAQVDNVTLTCRNLAPDCSAVAPSIPELWAPNHRYVAIDILGVTDVDGDEITINIDGIRQDEAVRGRGSGNTGMDGRGVGTSTAEVRAEASGRLNGRVYHIFFTANDPSGLSCSSVVNVGVPHDMGVNGPAIDDGPDFDSTRP